MVFRSIPVTRSIWRWLVLVASSVAIVVCRCGFKTFNPVSLVNEGVKVTSCLILTETVKQSGLARRYAALRVGEFEVATSGGIWVAIGAYVPVSFRTSWGTTPQGSRDGAQKGIGRYSVVLCEVTTQLTTTETSL